LCIGSVDCEESCCASAFAAASDCAMGNGLLAAGSVCDVDFDPDFAEFCDFADFVCVEESDWEVFLWEFADGASGGGLWLLLCCPHASTLPNSSIATNMGSLPRDFLKHSICTILDVFPPNWVGELFLASKNRQPCGCYTPSSASNIRMGLIVRSSLIHAAGCYTTTPIAKGTRVVEYTGPIIDKEEADRRYELKPITYLFGIGDGSKVIDGHGIAMFINHSCDANCETEEIDDRVWIMAIRDIAAGEELCYDYCLYDGDEEEAPCNCGAKNCRGSMYSAEELRRRKRLKLKQAKAQAAAKKRKEKSTTRKKRARPNSSSTEPANTSGKRQLQRKTSPASTQRKSTASAKRTKKAPGK
jgi:uncharacterized protein